MYSSSSWYSQIPESSDTAGENIRQANISDDEVMLASTHPKKRAGRKKFNETRHPVYRGVRQRSSGKWVCEVREPNKQSRIWLGTFPTAEMAARAHDVAVIALRGRSACLNFADSAWRLPVPASTEAKDIQKAAAEAAEAFRPPSDEGGVDGGCVEECAAALPENGYYVDEEAVFGMPAYIASMAEGMMLPPPQCGGDGGYDVDDMECGADVSLWSYSF